LNGFTIAMTIFIERSLCSRAARIASMRATSKTL
jgi:hypothetical protein